MVEAKSRRTVWLVRGAVMLATCSVLVFAPLSSASAAVVLEYPHADQLTGPSPAFSGSTDDTLDPITVVVHEGTTTAGATVQTDGPVTAGADGSWATQVAEPLAEATYTAVAEQAELGGLGQTTSSPPVTFTVRTAPPTVALHQPPTPSNDSNPSFSGSASDTTPVTVHVHRGPTVEGEEVASVSAPVAGGSWASGRLRTGLADGTYTAVAVEPSSLGNAPGVSNAVTFEVDTRPPEVTLDQLTTPSNDTTPSFSGTDRGFGSASTPIVVHVYEGSGTAGLEVARVSAPGVENGAWTSGPITLAGGEHTYTAVATQQSILGNGEGRSTPITFVVDTDPPKLTLNALPTPSRETTRSFSGTDAGAGSGGRPIVIHIYRGVRPEGEEVAHVQASGTEGGAWTSGSVTLEAGEHTYTAIATQESALGNPEGRSGPVTFTLDTNPPEVTLNQPPTPSRETTRSFTGSDAGAGSGRRPILVHIYRGVKPEGQEVAHVQAPGVEGGPWSSGSVSLEAGEHTYTAIATQESALGNPEGRSSPVTFTVDTNPPEVTLNPLQTPSRTAMPRFSGTDAGAGTAARPIVVRVYEGTKPEGTPVARALASGVEGGAWSTEPVALAQGEHTYTAIATQASPLENPEGRSAPITFVVDTEPPRLTLAQVSPRSNNTKPSFRGTGAGAGSAARQIVVHVFEGTKPEGTEVARITTPGAEGGAEWTTTAIQLPAGEHTFTAIATEESPLGNAEGRSAPVTFVVDTEPPKVTLNPPPAVSNDQHPSFSGTAGEAGSVTVRVYRGPEPDEHDQVALLRAAVVKGAWSTATVSPALEGEYTAVATEPSAIGNGEGHSEAAMFLVNTKAPTVTLDAPPSPSNNRSPTFSGTASAGKPPVTVVVYPGTRAEGTIVASATSSAGGGWTTGEARPTLPAGEHTYTAVATQPSELAGNPAGVSAPRTFVVDTQPPKLTIAPVAARSNEASPTFSGTTNDPASVAVSLYAGPSAEGTPLLVANGAASAGTWSAALAHALADGQYTAVATQQSSIGNGSATTPPVTFEIDTKPPAVTLNALPSPSSNASPSFSGTASEEREVTVDVFAGSTAEGSAPIASLTATVEGGEWTTGKLSPPLPWGQYSAVATQPSSIGNADGRSAPMAFTLEPIPPVVVTEGAPAVTRTSATLTGSVNPRAGVVTSCYFEYGTSTAYGQSVECAPLAEGANGLGLTGTTPVPVFARIFELGANVTYHYRLVAVDEGGIGFGADQSFTTPPPRFSEGEAPTGGSPPGTTTAAAQPAAAGGVSAAIARRLKPPGHGWSIGQLLKAGGYSWVLTLPEPGSVVIRWNYSRVTWTRGVKKHVTVLVAYGNSTLGSSGRLRIAIRLTPAGRALLARAPRILLTEVCIFRPLGQPGARTSTAFQLRR